jgi:hypothetical protein
MAEGIGLMAREGSFNVVYLAGMGALALLAAVAGLALTGERHSGFVGAIEVPVLLVGAALLVAGGVGAARSQGGSWPLLAVLAAVSLVAVLAFVTLSEPAVGSAVIFEFAAVVLGVFLAAVLRKG